MKRCYLTVFTDTKYLPGLRALKKSLLKTNTKYKLVVLIPTSEKDIFLPVLEKNKILDSFCEVKLYSNEILEHSKNITSHYWSKTFFKLAIFDLKEYEKIVFLDSDMMILNNIDNLFDAEPFSAVIAGKSLNSNYVSLNSGLMVIKPDHIFFTKCLSLIDSVVAERKKNDLFTGDQDIIKKALPLWNENKALHLDETYNCFFECANFVRKTSTSKIHIVHFVGAIKPWFKGTFFRNVIILLKKIVKFDFYSVKIFLKYIIFCKL